MEASLTIREVLAGNKIFVPTFHRAYSWETEFEKSKPPKHVNVFLSDLEDYIKSQTNSIYYFGHFLFWKKNEIHVLGRVDLEIEKMEIEKIIETEAHGMVVKNSLRVKKS